MPKLSQYEIEREANIARNRALLEELELKQAVAGLGIPISNPKLAPKTKVKPIQPKKRVKKEASEAVPRRQSSRLKRAAIDPDESPSKRQKREAELEEKRAKEAEERLEVEERARIANRPRAHDLALPILVGEDPGEVSSLSTTLQTVAQTAYPRRVGDPEAFALDSDKKNEAAVAELREHLQSLKIVSRAKVTQDRVYSAAYHPEVTKDLIFFGDKHGQLGIWDARAPADEATDEDGEAVTDIIEEGGKYWRLQVHWPATSRSSISSVKFDPINAHNVYTSSYDGSIRSLSFTTGISEQIYSTGKETIITSIDLTPGGNEMWISDGEGGVAHLDLREDRSNTTTWYGLSDAKIGCVSINPTRSHFLVTASNDRSLKIWDTRKLQDIAVNLSDAAPGAVGLEFRDETVSNFLETDAGKACMRAEWRHAKSVSSAYWDPRGRSIVSTSYDNKLRLWDITSDKFASSAPFPSSRPFSILDHNCQTGKWLTVLRAQWSPNPDAFPHFTIGNMNHSLDIFSCKGDLLARLADKEKISAVQAVTCSHPSIVERAASGNASGRCILWSRFSAE